ATVRPVGEIRLVQAANGGTVTNILVKENQVVKKGQTIALIDPFQLQIKKSQIIGKILQAKQQLVQLNTQIKALDGQIAAESETHKGLIASAEAELSREQRNYTEKKATSTADVEEALASVRLAQDELQKTHADLKSAEANKKSTEAAVEVAITRRDRYKSVAEAYALPRNQIEEAELTVVQQQQAFEQQRANIEGQKKAVDSHQRAIEVANAKYHRTLAALNPGLSAVIVAKQKVVQERAIARATSARFHQERENLLQRQTEIQTQISSAEKDLKQVEQDLQKTVIISPETGTILKLELRNPGQVVSPGEHVAQISPSNTPLELKARITAEDISKVQVCKAEKVSHCQQGKVQMRVSAYPYPDYGILKGAVRSISADAITPESNQKASFTPYYEVTIEPERLYLEKDNLQYPIQPGMEVVANIISKEETVLTFLLRKARLLSNVGV
ncbi:MAG: HlyD family efflux transporter periplasmic adaptor subunit, partial [Stigonema ocellatum SAG 48.90 = DSM 106950]|nr:HlyD family efflux transporter periplasmic adaptor subunit [Stigonema ocellatum SAG 48.90 = DSM 106950]